MFEFYGTIQGGEITLSNEQIVLRGQYLSELKDGTQIYERIGIYRRPKTDAQLKAFWGLFASTVINEFNDRGWDTSFILKIDKSTGIGIDRDLLKEYMYSVCSCFDDNHKKVTMSGMDTAQMAKFFDDCRNFAASQWSIYVPEPDKNWKENQGKSIIDKTREVKEGGK